MDTATAPNTIMSFLKSSAFLLFTVLMICASFPGCYSLKHEDLQGRAPSIFYVEAFERNDDLYTPWLYPNVTDTEKYEKMEPSYTYSAGSSMYFLLFMDDDLLQGNFSFSKPTVKVLRKDADTYVLEETINPAFAPIGIQQLWGTGYFTVPGSDGDTYKYLFTVPDTDGNVSEPAEVVITVVN